MTETPRNPNSERSLVISRRQALGLLGGAGAATLLTACGTQRATFTPTPAPTTAPAAQPTSTVVSAAGTVSVSATVAGVSTATRAASPAVGAPAASPAVGGITIPNTGAKLPTDRVTVRWTESSQFSKAFLPSFFPAYQQAHPNITVQYDNLPDTELARVLQLAFQSGNTPDVFRLLPNIIPEAQAVRQGLVAPLDDLVPNFAQWKAAFPPGSFTEGVNVFNGKTYTFPMLGKFSWVLQYNRAYMQQAGYDPVAQPLTWEQFRAAAKKLTEQGQGKYYGLVIGGADIGRWAPFVSYFGQLAGAPGGEFNYKTGEYNYTSAPFQAAIELLLALKADGSIFPGSVSLNSDQARATMPQGGAAMILNETGIIPFWIKENPSFNFDVAALPVPNSGTPGPIYVGPPGGFWWVSAKSRYGAVAGDIFAYLGSQAGQTTWQTVGGGSIPVSFPKANQEAELDLRLRRAYGLFDAGMRIGPEPAVRNPDVSLVRQEQRALTPNFGTVVQGIFTGQISDSKRAMQDLQDRATRELERAIGAAQSKGAKVARSDFAFPNWDPSKDYTEADYAALKR